MNLLRLRFYDPPRFAFVAPLEEHWRAIYEEYQKVRDSLVDWGEKKLYEQGWQVFTLFSFPHGEPIAANAERCAFTASQIERHFTRHGAAGFSVLRAGSRIKPHHGYQGEFLRCHLGLSIPQGDCGLRIEDDTRHWEEGKVLVFDDRFTHEAWNLTTEERVVLLIDFIPEP